MSPRPPAAAAVPVLFLLFLPSGLPPAAARADVVVLKAGGEVRGDFVGDPRDGDAVTVRTRSGAEVAVPRAAIRGWDYRTPDREEFEYRFDRTAAAGDAGGEGGDADGADAAAAWWDLARWALARRLSGERRRALERVILAEPRHEDARKALGHVRDDGEWLSREQWRAKRGLVLYGGRAVSPEERDLLAAADAGDAARRAWYRDVRRWHRALSGRDADGAGPARAALASLTDPDAAEALRKFFADDPAPALRTLYVRTLARMEGVGPVPALADQAMRDVDGTVRRDAVAALAPPDRAEAALPLLRKGLRSEENLTVRRTASALAAVGDERAVPDLIKSLVTTHFYKVAVPDGGGASMARGPGGTSFGGGLGGGGGPVALPPQVAGALLTGQLPAGVNIIRPNRVGPTRLTTVKVDHTNPEVLRALQILTANPPAPGGTAAVPPPDGYDEAAWAAWWARNGGAGG